MALAEEAEIQKFLEQHPEWSLESGRLTATVTLEDFAEAMSLVTRIALMAEKADHHPDITISWNRVGLQLSTHSEGGVTSKDLALAARLPLS